MDTTAEVKYRTEPKRGGIFQLWTTEDTQDANKETLVLLFGFYGATERVISRYCDIYLTRGLPVLYIPSQLQHFALPSYSVKLGKELMDYLDHEAVNFSYYLIHTSSMGSYNFAVCNYAVMSEYPETYGHIKSKIKAIVYDSLSVGSVERMTNGIGQGMIRNKILRAVVPKLMSLYFFLMQDKTIKKFEEWVEMFKTVPLEVPTLYFFCENDHISDHEYIHDMIKGFRKMDTFPVIEQCWQKSRHAFHLFIHTDDYLHCVERLFRLVPELKLHKDSAIKSKM